MPFRPALTVHERLEHARVVEPTPCNDLHWYPLPARPLLKGADRVGTAPVEIPTAIRGLSLREELDRSLYDLRVALRLMRARRRRVEQAKAALHAGTSTQANTSSAVLPNTAAISIAFPKEG